MRWDPKSVKKKLSLSRQDRKFLTMFGLAFGFLALILILDGLGVI